MDKKPPDGIWKILLQKTSLKKTTYQLSIFIY